MKRALFSSLTLIAVGLMAGCGGSSGGGGSTPPQPNALNGQYAFVLTGFDPSNNHVGIAGSLKANGLGQITAGEVDVNDNGVISSSDVVAGSYAFDSTGDGSTGTIQLTNTVGSVAHALGFAFSLQLSGNFGQIMSLDANNFVAAGTMQLQSAAVFTLSGMAGSYVGTLNGPTSFGPTSALGRFTLSSSGAASNVEFDRSVAGTSTGSVGPTTTGATIPSGFSAPDSNGRGTFTLSLSDTFGTTSQVFAYYAITASRFVAVETDSTANEVMTADFSGQASIPANAAGAGIFGISAVDVAASNEISAVGQLQILSATPTLATLNWDANDAGTNIHSGIVGSSEAVAYDATTGRGTVTVGSGTAQGLANTLVFYLSAPGEGFVLDGTTGTSNTAMAGPMLAQAAGPFSSTTDLAGVGIVRTRGNHVNNEISLVGLFGPATGGGYALEFYDRTASGGALSTNGPPVANNGVAASLVGIDPNVGRGTFSFAFSSGPSSYAFYVIRPNQFYMIDLNPADGASSVFFVSPQ
jgi:hypothetical protein